MLQAALLLLSVLGVNGLACPTVTIVHTVPYTQINQTIAPDNLYGVEDGTVVRTSDGVFHLVTAEMYKDPKWVAMRLGAWQSYDGYNFSRVGTLRESSAIDNGSDPRAAVWGPMYIWDETANRWALVYVGYRCAPNNASGWLGNYDGTIWAAYSAAEGDSGIAGPFVNDTLTFQPLQPFPGPPYYPYQGLQGTDSQYAWQLPNGTWISIYGTAHTENNKNFTAEWVVGLAVSPTLTGPWRRYPFDDPTIVNLTTGGFSENPVVALSPSGNGYMAVFDLINGEATSFGFSCSADGVVWEVAAAVPIVGGCRTPLALIPFSSDDLHRMHDVLAQHGVNIEAAADFISKSDHGAVPGNSASAIYWLFYTVVEGWEVMRTAIVQLTW